MKLKVISLLLILCFSSCLLFASNLSSTDLELISFDRTSLQKLQFDANLFQKGLTFVAIYDKALDAVFSKGQPRATFAASRDSTHPATFFSLDGVIHETETSNVGRFNYGYYDDTTNFIPWSDRKAGVMIESASTNYLIDSMFGRAIGADDWTSIWGTITDSATSLINITGAKERNIAYTFLGTENDFEYSIFQVTANDSFDASGGNVDITLSFWAKGDVSGITTGTGDTWFCSVVGVQNDNTFEETAISINLNDASVANLSATEFRRFTYSGTLADIATDKVQVFFMRLSNQNHPAASEDFDITYTGDQIEKSPHATSFIPTTTAALTRNAETNKYGVVGNRTAGAETMIIKFAPEFTSATGAGNSYLIDTETKRRYMAWFNDTSCNFRPNHNDSINCLSFGGTLTANTETTFGSACQHSSPYAEIYKDGSSTGTPETVDNFADNAWGTYFWVGSSGVPSEQLNSTIKSIAFWKRRLTDPEQKFMHDVDWSTLDFE